MQPVFSYTDYRKLLLDFYNEKKAANPAFSHRLIAQKVGFKSGGHFSLILTGRANISIRFIEKLAQLMKLNKRECVYFQNLVLFNQAKDHVEKKMRFEKLISFKESVIRTVNADQYEFYDKWHHTAIRELLAFYPFDGNDFESLGSMLSPSINAKSAKQSIELLIRLNLIVRGENGYYRPTDALISAGVDAKSLFIYNFYAHALRLARESMDRCPRTERNLSWVAMSVSDKTYNKIVDETREFRKRIMEMAQEDASPNRVYLLNIQSFPLSRSRILETKQ